MDKTLNWECPTWIENNPIAKGYRNACEAGNIDRLFHNFIFTGNQAASEQCMTDFSELLQAYGVSADQIRFNKANPTGDRAFYLYDDAHKALSPDEHIAIDITSITFRDKAIESIVLRLGLSASYEKLEDYLSPYPDWKLVEENRFINNTLLMHYRRSVDNVLAPEDLEWLNEKDLCQNIKLESESEPESDQNVPGDKPAETKPAACQPSTAPAEISSEDSSLNEAGNVSDEAADTDTYEKEPDQQTSSAESDHGLENTGDVEGPEDIETLPSNTENNNVTPSETPAGEHEPLSLEDKKAIIEANRELGKGIYNVYQETITFLKSQHDVRWNEFIDQYKNALVTGDYSVRVCKRYLEITQGNSKGPVYATLYKADTATKEYQRDIRRIIEKTHCFGCGEDFDADLTFARTSEWEVTCPKCGRVSRKMIEWL